MKVIIMFIAITIGMVGLAQAQEAGTLTNVKPGQSQLSPRSMMKRGKKVSTFEVYPNPFSTNTTLSFKLEKMSRVKLEVYNSLAQRVSVVADETLPQGKQQFTLSAESLPEGIYFCRLILDNSLVATKRIQVQKTGE